MKRFPQMAARLFAAFTLYSFVVPALAFGNVPPAVGKSLTEDQKILHVLNRLGFGARPGDVERVKKIGLEKYIDQQLNPSTIDDSVAEAKVKGLEIFNMSTAEVFEKYPNPGALLRQLNGGRQAQAKNTAVDDKNPQPKDPQDMTDQERKERQQELAKLYREYDLRPAGQLMPQIVANRVLRAVYS